MSNEVNDYLTLLDVAELFKVSVRTVRNWVKSKGLQPLKVGGLVRFERAEVERWVKKQNEK